MARGLLWHPHMKHAVLSSALCNLVLAAALSSACGPAPADHEVTDAPLLAAGFDAELISTDLPTTLRAGERVAVNIVLRNTGAASPANDWLAGSDILFSDTLPRSLWGWTTSQLAADVPVGETTTIIAVLTAPTGPPSADFLARMRRPGEGYFGPVIAVPSISLDANQGQRWACAHESNTIPATMSPGDRAEVTVTLRNAGTATWLAGAVCLKSRDADRRLWGAAASCPEITSDVAPGETTTLSFSMLAPSSSGTYGFARQLLDRSAGGLGLFDRFNNCVDLSIEVAGPPALDAEIVSHDLPASLNEGEVRAVNVQVRNTGTETWAEADRVLLLSDSRPRSLFGRPHASVPGVVSPGDTVTISFDITAPDSAGDYSQAWRLFKSSNPGARFLGPVVAAPLSVTAASFTLSITTNTSMFLEISPDGGSSEFSTCNAPSCEMEVPAGAWVSAESTSPGARYSPQASGDFAWTEFYYSSPIYPSLIVAAGIMDSDKSLQASWHEDGGATLTVSINDGTLSGEYIDWNSPGPHHPYDYRCADPVADGIPAQCSRYLNEGTELDLFSTSPGPGWTVTVSGNLPCTIGPNQAYVACYAYVGTLPLDVSIVWSL